MLRGLDPVFPEGCVRNSPEPAYLEGRIRFRFFFFSRFGFGSAPMVHRYKLSNNSQKQGRCRVGTIQLINCTGKHFKYLIISRIFHIWFRGFLWCNYLYFFRWFLTPQKFLVVNRLKIAPILKSDQTFECLVKSS